MKPAIKYLYEIDGHFLKCKQERISRLSIEWGEWSAEMNREIRQRIEDNDPESLILKYIFMYWVARSQHLELIHKTRNGLFAKAKIRRKNNECVELRKIITDGVETDPYGLKIEGGWTDFVTNLKWR